MAGLPSAHLGPSGAQARGRAKVRSAWSRGWPDTVSAPRGSQRWARESGGAEASPQPDLRAGPGLRSRSEADAAHRKAPGPLQAADPCTAPGSRRRKCVWSTGLRDGRTETFAESSLSQTVGSLSAQLGSQRPGRAGGAMRTLWRRQHSVGASCTGNPVLAHPDWGPGSVHAL